MTKYFSYILLIMVLITISIFYHQYKKTQSVKIRITWSDDVSGDFSFIKNWEYPEGVYRNEFGQLSCDGLCPENTDLMKDNNGKILADSLDQFYKLVDTTHQFQSIQSESNSPEWLGTNYVTVSRINSDTTICYTHYNTATNSKLILTITNDTCIPTIELVSILPSDMKTYTCKSGKIEIDRNFWNKGILKANFNINFHQDENQDTPIFWKGKIYKHIE